MKKLLLTGVLFAFSTLLFANQFSPALDSLRPKAGHVVLKKGTAVMLLLDENILSEDAHEGQNVALRIQLDLVKDGKIAIHANDFASGQVSFVRRRAGFGRAATIEIEGLQVRAVDGQLLKIKGLKIERTGRNSRGFALATTAALAISGVALPPVLLLMPIGFFIKGKDVRFERGATFQAFLAEDAIVRT